MADTSTYVLIKIFDKNQSTVFRKMTLKVLKGKPTGNNVFISLCVRAMQRNKNRKLIFRLMKKVIQGCIDF